MQVIKVNPEKCTGCHQCELWCGSEIASVGKELPLAITETPQPVPRVYVEGKKFALQCRHCETAPCLEACLTGALVRDPDTQLVVIRENRCIGCWTCALFCPYGVIYPWPQRGIALKCDRCLYMENPI